MLYLQYKTYITYWNYRLQKYDVMHDFMIDKVLRKMNCLWCNPKQCQENTEGFNDQTMLSALGGKKWVSPWYILLERVLHLSYVVMIFRLGLVNYLWFLNMRKLQEMSWMHRGQKQRRAQEKDGMSLRPNWTIFRWISCC